MSWESLARLLNDRNITINIKSLNIQTGDHATQYNGTTQINNYAAPSQIERSRWEYRCERCGYTSHERHEFIDQEGGYGHHSYLCDSCDRKKQLAERLSRASSVIVEPESKIEQIEAPRQEPQVVVVDTKRLAFEQRYREMQAAHAAHIAAEFEFIERQRESGAYRMVKPLPAGQHTHTPEPAETDRERKQRAEREWMQDLID